MYNKHKVQKDFYTKMAEWKQGLKAEKEIEKDEKSEGFIGVIEKQESQKLTLREACYRGITGAINMTEEMAERGKSTKHKALVQEANNNIEKIRERSAKAAMNAAREMPCRERD